MIDVFPFDAFSFLLFCSLDIFYQKMWTKLVHYCEILNYVIEFQVDNNLGYDKIASG